MVSVKKLTIFFSMFFSKIGLERKEAFEDDKNLNFFKCKKWVFSTGVQGLATV